MKYIIITAPDIDQLARRVNRKEKYKPIGGPFVLPDKNEWRIVAQAMVKKWFK